jgi:hypothetical protein
MRQIVPGAIPVIVLASGTLTKSDGIDGSTDFSSFEFTQSPLIAAGVSLRCGGPLLECCEKPADVLNHLPPVLLG